MTYYPDLDPLDYFTLGETFGGRLRAVGWLSPGYPFPTGNLPDPVVERLIDLLLNGEELIYTCGSHPCLFCLGFTDVADEDPPQAPADPTFLSYRTRTLTLGATNLWIPAGGFMYVAPSLIIHYVTEHRYQPPSEFLDSLASSPIPGTPDYLEAIGAFRDFMNTRLGGEGPREGRVP